MSSRERSGSFHSSHSQSMTEGQAEVMIERARSQQKMSFSCVLWVTTDILMHAADERLGAVQMLRMKSMALTSMSNSVARSCPRELLRIVVAVIAVWNTKLLRQCTLLKLAKISSVAWQLIATRRLYLTKSAGGLECVMKSLCVGCM